MLAEGGLTVKGMMHVAAKCEMRFGSRVGLPHTRQTNGAAPQNLLSSKQDQPAAAQQEIPDVSRLDPDLRQQLSGPCCQCSPGLH